MNEDESKSNFNTKLHDIAKTYFALGEKISEKNLVKKILRSLTEKFDIKVIIIEQAQEFRSIKVDELIGSLKTFEFL